MLMIDIILFLLFWICISILCFYCVLGLLKSNHLFQLEKCMNNVKYIDILLFAIMFSSPLLLVFGVIGFCITKVLNPNILNILFTKIIQEIINDK